MSLFCLYVGVVAVIISIFVIDPETAPTAPYAFQDLPAIVWALCWAAAIVALALLAPFAKIGGLAVKLFLESVDRPLIGTEIKVGKALLSLWRGYVQVSNVVMLNPSGSEWKTETMLVINELTVHIYMWRLVRTGFHELEVIYLRIHGVDVAFEKPSNGNSNMREVLEYIDSTITPATNLLTCLCGAMCMPVCLAFIKPAIKVKEALLGRR